MDCFESLQNFRFLDSSLKKEIVWAFESANSKFFVLGSRSSEQFKFLQLFVESRGVPTKSFSSIPMTIFEVGGAKIGLLRGLVPAIIFKATDKFVISNFLTEGKLAAYSPGDDSSMEIASQDFVDFCDALFREEKYNFRMFNNRDFSKDNLIGTVKVFISSNEVDDFLKFFDMFVNNHKGRLLKKTGKDRHYKIYESYFVIKTSISKDQFIMEFHLG